MLTEYATNMSGLGTPHFEVVDLVQYCVDGILKPECLSAAFNDFRKIPSEQGVPRVLSLGFGGVSEVELPALDKMAEEIQAINRIRTEMGKQVFVRAVNVGHPLSETISGFLGRKELVLAVLNMGDADKTVTLLGKERFVIGYSPAFSSLSQTAGWVRGAIYLRDQLGIRSPDARSKLMAMFQLGIVIARGDVGQNGVVHSLV